jgi:hypothetical protein
VYAIDGLQLTVRKKNVVIDVKLLMRFALDKKDLKIKITLVKFINNNGGNT